MQSVSLYDKGWTGKTFSIREKEGFFRTKGV